MSSLLRVGNAQGFWGDRVDAAAELIAAQPDLDYITLDYLAEVTLSIMAAQQERNPAHGYARDFVDVVRSLVPIWQEGSKVRLVTNAGGLNPEGCAEACLAALRAAGCPTIRIAVVTGDNVLPQARAAVMDGNNAFSNLETGAPIESIGTSLVTANAYLGAQPIVAAIETGAEIIITGRITDPSLVVAPCVHHFGWAWDDYDQLAGATTAGHLLECGVQTTGGISTHWLDLSDPENLGFPFAEIAADGSSVITKPAGTGGVVNEETVKEQLLYEIGDPFHIISPDVVVSFAELRVKETAPNRVRVWGSSGSVPPESYKVSATYHDGFSASGTLTVFGQQAVEKARRCGEVVLARVRKAGYDLQQTNVECLGVGAALAGVLPEPELIETVLRVTVADPRKEAVERFSKELAPLVTAGAQGVTGFAAGRPRVSPVYGYWPALIEKKCVIPKIDLLSI